jgi:hypothetical protein
MKIKKSWRDLGYKHIVWELLRFYLSIKSEPKQIAWLREIEKNCAVSTGKEPYPLQTSDVELLVSYLEDRETASKDAFNRLRDEQQARKFCDENRISFGTTATKSKDHHQASKALVATVSAIAREECSKRGILLNHNPQNRCVWCTANGLHVTARNLDGAIPSTTNPTIIWEIKEYWGKTSGGSKMSDAVYECNLVGRELRDFEKSANLTVTHVVFVDGREQWSKRKSDLNRLIDLTHQGLIDILLVGTDVEGEWKDALVKLLKD